MSSPPRSLGAPPTVQQLRMPPGVGALGPWGPRCPSASWLCSLLPPGWLSCLLEGWLARGPWRLQRRAELCGASMGKEPASLQPPGVPLGPHRPFLVPAFEGAIRFGFSPACSRGWKEAGPPLRHQHRSAQVGVLVPSQPGLLVTRGFLADANKETLLLKRSADLTSQRVTGRARDGRAT